MKRNQKHMILAAAAMAVILPAGADPVTIPNAGFEHRATYDPFPESTDKYNQWSQETWRHWEVDNNGGPLRIWNPGDPENPAHLTTQGALDVGFGGNAPEGDYMVVVRSRYNDNEFHDPPQVRDFEAAVQILEETFDPTMTYTLTVQVGQLLGSVNYTPNWFGYAVQLAVGGTNVSGATFQGRVEGGMVIAQDMNTQTVPLDGFVTSTVRYTPDPAHAALAGMPLQIRLCALEDPADHSLTGWVAFDDVKLDASTAPPFVLHVARNMPDLDFTWPSQAGMVYRLWSSPDVARPISDWDLVDEDLPATPPTGAASIVQPGGDLLVYRMEAYVPPPVVLFAESFDGAINLPAGWTTGANGPDTGTTLWELGDPTGGAAGGPAAANSAPNCVGTNLSADYGFSTDIWLRTDTIDLTAHTEATLTFQQVTEIEQSFDHGSIRILDASNDGELAVLENQTIEGTTNGVWTEYAKALPAAAFTVPIKIEFRFEADDFENQAGWYLDDLLITSPYRAPPLVVPEMVNVGDPGNLADTADNGEAPGDHSGSVASTYKIGKYEVSNTEYATFLNAVDPTGVNALGLHEPRMGTDANNGGITLTPGNADGQKYAVKAGFANKPVVYVSFFDAMRFCNWLHNGAQAGGDTESGAYTLQGGEATPTNGTTVERNSGAKFAVPTEDEWYKAAYHQPRGDSGDTDNYWLYPTGSNSRPNASAPPGTAPAANYDFVEGSVTDVGAYASTEGYYGTFDMAGNAYEWIETIRPGGSSRLLRGGSWDSFDGFLRSNLPSTVTPGDEDDFIGFRISSP